MRVMNVLQIKPLLGQLPESIAVTCYVVKKYKRKEDKNKKDNNNELT